MLRPISIIAWLLLPAGIAAWVGVVLFYGAIKAKEEQRTARLQEIAQARQEEADASRIQTIAHDTKEGRTALEKKTSTELLAAVKIVESVGTPIGLPVKISSAAPAGPLSKSATLKGISFTLQSEGSYNALMRLIQLIETMPVPVLVDSVDLYKVNGENVASDPTKPQPAKPGEWHLDIRIRFLTSAAITS